MGSVNKIKLSSILIIVIALLLISSTTGIEEDKEQLEENIQEEISTDVEQEEIIIFSLEEITEYEEEIQGEETIEEVLLEQEHPLDQEETILVSLEEITEYKENRTHEKTISQETVLPLEEIIKENSNESNSTTNTTQTELSLHIVNSTNQTNQTIMSDTSKNMKSSPQESISLDSETIVINNERSPTLEKVQKIHIALSKNEKIELEGEIPESFDTNLIQKKESQIDELKKEVIIKSEEHLGDPLTIYTDIPEVKGSQISYVEVYWVNEEKKVEISGFYDLDENGLYDRISWIVPHLSEQIFTVTVNPQEGNNTISELSINLVSSPSGTITISEILFNYTIDYDNFSLTECVLNITHDSFEIERITTTSGQEISLPDLQDGDYSWLLSCYDTINITKSDSKTGSFTINEGYGIETDKKIYLLGENVVVEVTAINDEEISLLLDRPSSADLTTSTISNSHLFSSSDVNERGTYQVSAIFDNLYNETTLQTNFSVIEMSITISDDEVETGEDLSISTEIYSSQYDIVWVIMDYSEDSDPGTIINPHHYQETFSVEYSEEGSYNVELKVGVQGPDGIIQFTKTQNGITVTSSQDNENPDITLLQPTNNIKTKDETITFRYKAKDNIKLKDCTFELYLWEESSGTLDYDETVETPDNNEEIRIELTSFEEGDYSWNVYCCDNSSNCNDYDDYEREFTVDYSEASKNNNENNYSQKQEVEETIDILEDYLEIEKTLDPDEKQALRDLGVEENITFFKKRLVQIDQDLAFNINFISTEALREERRTQLIQEYKEIRKHIPTNIEILEQIEFTKNSITRNLEEIIKEYTTSKNIQIDERSIEKLAELNFKIQNYMKVSTIAKKIRINYENSNQELTLVTKKLELNNNSFETIVETTPENSKVTYITPAIKLEDNLYEIKIDDLDEDEIIYYTQGFTELDKVEETDTLLFKNFIVEKSKITGLFFIGELTDNTFLSYIIFIALVLVIIFLGKWVIIRAKLTKWKKEEDVRRIIEAIKKSKEELKNHDVKAAKELYHHIKELFPLVPEGFRKYSFKEIKRIRIGIDRREILLLVKEYEEAKSNGRKDEAKRIYENVKATYKRLPKKDQEKIYNRMFKSTFEI